MIKSRGRNLNFIPVTTNFSELRQSGEEVEIQDDFAIKFDADREYERLICNMLYNLNSREKVAFMFLVLKNDGYQFDNISIARTLGIKLRTYMSLARDVKFKFASYLKRTGKMA